MLAEQRRLSQNLTLHYKRVLYVVVSTPASEDARGKRVAVRENEDGGIQVEQVRFAYRQSVRDAEADTERRLQQIVQEQILRNAFRP